MKAPQVYIVTRNGVVEIATKDLKFAYTILQKLSTAVGKPALLSYVQVTRIMNEAGTFIHQWAAGQSFEIITRELMYTRRGTRKRSIENAREELAQHINP